VAATRMISIVGKKDAGKTTLVVALAAELVRRKFRVMTLKHGTHAADWDQRGKDTWRHRHEGKAERVVLEAPMVTDNAKFRGSFPVFRFSDTAWLVTLANIAWDRALILPP